MEILYNFFTPIGEFCLFPLIEWMAETMYSQSVLDKSLKTTSCCSKTDHSTKFITNTWLESLLVSYRVHSHTGIGPAAYCSRQLEWPEGHSKGLENTTTSESFAWYYLTLLHFKWWDFELRCVFVALHCTYQDHTVIAIKKTNNSVNCNYL